MMQYVSKVYEFVIAFGKLTDIVSCYCEVEVVSEAIQRDYNWYTLTPYSVKLLHIEKESIEILFS